ncbi:MAG: hypothetical protein DRP62_06190 [Planctomycetota bacterium]|nr:MAG: hypothetical protein DRP62_06190 [Planctomycetota bacterium]
MLAGLKFADVGLVFAEYLKSIEGRFLDPDVQLNLARKAVAEADFIKGAKLWVDGFASFTASELALLAELMKTAAETQIALCLDSANLDLKRPNAESIDPIGLFEPTERTYTELVELINECKLKLVEPIILEEPVRFAGCKELAHIERNIFSISGRRLKIGNRKSVRIAAAPNARCEVQFVARQILKLVREKDYRYRDIAVIASDIERYEHYIRAYFDDYNLPFFIDKRKSLNQHPVVQLICSALDVITGGFSGGDVFAYLKTDLVPIERFDVDMLENYCLAFGVRGSDWTSGQDWRFAGQDEEQFDERRINQIRLKVSEPLLKLREQLCPADDLAKKINADEFRRIIFDFLDKLEVPETLENWIEQAGEREDYTTIDEHRQFYDKFVDMFSELVEVFAGQELTVEDYSAIIKSAFSQLMLAFIPPTLDQVLVGSIERSRHPDLKAVFLIGATQKQFPVPVNYSGILTDDDRCAAESADFALAATTSQTLAERQYLTYIAFTRASEFMCITYPLANEKGSAEVRSQFIDNLESLFDNLNEESIAAEQSDELPERIYNEAELADLLCSRLGAEWQRGKGAKGQRDKGTNDELGELLDDICADEQLGEIGAMVRSAINYENLAHLDKEIAGKLFGRQIKSSATKLGDFAACPYKYFAEHILELQERKESKLEPLDIGRFYHSVLDSLLKQLNAENKDFATIDDKELLELLTEQEAKIVQTDTFISNFSRHSEHNKFIIHSAGEVLEDCVLAIAQMVRAGRFRPIWSEIKFDEEYGQLGKYELMLSDNHSLILRGKIDRLDIAEINGEKIAIVFDYKKSKDKASFSWSKFYYGLDMQLPIYMSAIRQRGRADEIQDVAGAFYMPIEVSPKKSELDELPKKADSFGYKANGIFNGEFVQQLDEKTTAGWSKFYNFRITSKNKQYGDYGKSGALRPGDFEKVLEFTERKIIQLAEQILSGKIDIKPYKLGKERPCTYCKYKSLCRFDWQINDYNSLVPVGKTEVLKRIEAKEVKVTNLF